MHSTFSIVARDPASGLLGTAITTMVPAAGSICPHIRHGIGAVCTQGWTNPYLAPAALDRMARGYPAPEALAEALATDPEASMRQVLAVDATGRAAVHSGEETNPWSGGVTLTNLALAGNFLAGPETLEAMRAVMTGSPDTPAAPADLYQSAIALGDRLVAALAAGGTSGGDWRGNRSAAVLVAGPDIYPLVDLRVDHHSSPLAELRRVFEVSRDLWFPFLRAVPTRSNPRGDWASVRASLQEKAPDSTSAEQDSDPGPHAPE